VLSYTQENEGVLLILGVLSVVSFVATLVVIPWIVLRIPNDYFSRPVRVALVSSDSHPSVKVLVFIAKNLLGLAVVLLGIAMLVIPGQGLLTILIGVILIDFPGKYKFLRWLISRKPVMKSANWLRAKGGKEPLAIDREVL
jgi:Putative transmembrane protein (PGPGW)